MLDKEDVVHVDNGILLSHKRDEIGEREGGRGREGEKMMKY